MKSIFLVLVFCLSSISFAASTKLNLDKLKAEAIAEITKFYGGNVMVDDGKFYYRDGVGSIGLEPLFDYSGVIFIATPSIPLERAGLKVGYRLSLIGETMVVLPDLIVHEGVMVIYFPGSIIAGFKGNTSRRDQDKIVTSLRASGLVVNHLTEIGMAIVSGEPHLVIKAAAKLRAEPKVDSVMVDNEMYRHSFHFDPFLIMSQQTGVIDVDSLRTTSADFHAEGAQFAYWTNVPERLR